MKLLETTWLTTGNIHHAYFLVGEPSVVVPHVREFLEKTVNIQLAGNPDVWHGRFDVFTIDDARQLSDSQERKSFQTNTQANKKNSERSIKDGKNKEENTQESRKIFIIETNSITESAQNSLLKVFEEPTVGTHFFIISPQDTLLPTLRSRMQVVDARYVREYIYRIW